MSQFLVSVVTDYPSIVPYYKFMKFGLLFFDDDGTIACGGNSKHGIASAANLNA